MGRKKARDNAFKCLYQLGFDFDLKLENVLKHSYEENISTEEEKEYISELLRGIIINIDAIDEEILKNLKDWSIDRIAKIDLAILRLAIYEIKYIENIPVKVSVNEAVELAKMYGNDTSANFVNGLLAKVIL
ncbi:MAG: transcription antitermination factor NusB [Clostridia bacterium]|nr:transcription antitermination factor NusB [Clostridia bacterium]MDD4386642.1 transcription antitermination factor NusB [Clostridia bacterium]